mmetsp:Transcript_80203/g.248930  ORF Transcript_80203/g.248930 Transcript_80203/m.248930 type:complete len:517 (+) Transcript_80203:112-1662(+)|eukprot:CAMPEP_0204585856 /NCGR_PEP_ID=MMETSP0661-20131031/47155_1 /ASSEMBLY_ACC=CAM_ASM_000606 /TAXON_ID=109239 /ORGANISM="Alexandrium margalefi, Strain AMGDE01CS-322" /LENGTH=516 /DNA_ID=CAMNT_0051595443 /DNA_START=79 /DNA_END=1629 /DNA_ORIENTATION=-
MAVGKMPGLPAMDRISRRLSTGSFRGVSGMMYLLGFNAAVGGFLFGYDTGSMSAALLQVKRPNLDSTCPGLDRTRLTPVQQELVISFVVLGAFLGSLCSGSLNDLFGRRRILLTGSFVFTIGAILMAAAHNIQAMLIARIIVGLGVGVSSHTVPLYIAECAPPKMRGGLCFLNDMMVTIGQVSAAVISTVLFFAEVRGGWRWILGVAALPSVLMFLGFFWMPESPRWLLSQGRFEEAMVITRMLRGPVVRDSDLEREFHDTVSGTSEDAPLTPGGGRGSTWALYWKDARVRRALMLGCGLQCLQQWAGINTIMYYGASVLQKAGESQPAASTCFTAESKHDVATTIYFALAQVVGVFISWLMVDRLGRRPLLLTSLVGVMASLFATGCVFSRNEVSQVSVVVAVVVYLVFFGVGLSPVPWTVNAEIYPLHVRAQCVSMSTCANWIMNFVVAQTFLSFSKGMSTHRDNPKAHPDGIFWLYSGISAVGLFFVWFRMPETKGLSLEEIGDLFQAEAEAK